LPSSGDVKPNFGSMSASIFRIEAVYEAWALSDIDTYDVDLDGVYEIILCAGAKVYIIDNYTTHLFWDHSEWSGSSLRGSFMIEVDLVKVFDVDLDGDMEFIGLDDRRVLVVDYPSGDVIAVGGVEVDSQIADISIVNFDDDPYPEFVVSRSLALEFLDDIYNNLTTLYAIQYNLESGNLEDRALVVDYDNDSLLECLVHCSRLGLNFEEQPPIVVESGSWDVEELDYYLWDYIAMNIDDDPTLEVIATIDSGKKFILLDGDDVIVVVNKTFACWEIAGVDFDVDGVYEVIAVSCSGFHILDIDDNFSMTYVEPLPWSPNQGWIQRGAFGDVDGDFLPDIVYGDGYTLVVYDGQTYDLLYCLNMTSMVRMVLLANVDSDEYTEIVAVDDNGIIVVIETRGLGTPWPTCEGDISASCILSDSDHDGLPDYSEFYVGTDMWHNDSDGDSMPDGRECLLGLNPLSNDTDGDGMLDGWEMLYGFDPLEPDLDEDLDNDGLSNVEESICFTDPYSPDTDNDSMPDGWEVAYGLDPTDPSDAAIDIDGDGLSNAEEYLWRTDPTRADSDSDGWFDREEIILGSDPLDKDSHPASAEDIIMAMLIAIFVLYCLGIVLHFLGYG